MDQETLAKIRNSKVILRYMNDTAEEVLETIQVFEDGEGLKIVVKVKKRK